MTQRRPFLACLVAIMALDLLMPAAGAGPKTKAVSGTWVCSLTGPRGRKSKVRCVLKQKGTTLTGVMGPLRRPTKLSGTIKDGQVSFTFQRQLPNGRGSFTVRYQGELKGNTIQGTAEQDFGSGQKHTLTWTAKRVK
jgi:hypothetical protein